MFANACHQGQETHGSPPEAPEDTDSELGDLLPEPIIDFDPVKRYSPALPIFKRDHPFDEEESPVLQPTRRNNPFDEEDSPALPVNAGDQNSIENLSYGRGRW
jgi:hypothetical protein